MRHRYVDGAKKVGGAAKKEGGRALSARVPAALPLGHGPQHEHGDDPDAHRARERPDHQSGNDGEPAVSRATEVDEAVPDDPAERPGEDDAQEREDSRATRRKPGGNEGVAGLTRVARTIARRLVVHRSSAVAGASFAAPVGKAAVAARWDRTAVDRPPTMRMPH